MPEATRSLMDLLEDLAAQREALLALSPDAPERPHAQAKFDEGMRTLRARLPSAPREVVRGPLDAAARAADILTFEVPPSHRRRLGPVITGAKRAALEAVRPAWVKWLRPQRDFNVMLLEVLGRLLDRAHSLETGTAPAKVVEVAVPLPAALPLPVLRRQAAFNAQAVRLAEVAAAGLPSVDEANALVATLAALVDPLAAAGSSRRLERVALRGVQPLLREALRRQVAFNNEVVLVLSNLLNGRPPVSAPPPDDYERWHRARDAREHAAALARLAKVTSRPLVSVVVPAWETPADVLEQMIASVRAQSWERWELCVVDDGSRKATVRRVMAKWAKRDPRIRFQRLEGKGSIARATNAALAMATGDFVAFLDHDDALAPHALAEVVAALDAEPTLDWLYSDEDRLSADGRRRHSPMMKPGFSWELLRSNNYICHFVVVRAALARELGIRESFQGAQDYDFLLRLAERTTRVKRIPRVLYHWRQSDLSLSQDEEKLRAASAAGARALREHLERSGEAARVEDLGRGEYRVRHPVRGAPKVSIIVPFKDRPELLDLLTRTLLPLTAYQNYELLLVSNNSARKETFELLDRLTDPRIRKLEWNHPFNYPALNNWAAKQATGEFLLFLNNDMEVVDPDWLHELLGHAQRPKVGMVGPKLKFPDGSIQHAGVVVGIGGYAAHPFWRFPDTGHRTPFGTADWNRNYLAVTSACVLQRREVFEHLGGFDERFVVCGSDVDLGIRTHQMGLQVVYTAGTWLYHHESASRRNTRIPAQDLWHSVVRYRPWLEGGDPFYNPNLDLLTTDTGLEEDGRSAVELAAQAIVLAAEEGARS